MKIVLAVTNKKSATILYVTDDGAVRTSQDMLTRAHNNEVDGVYVVTRQRKSYLRARRNKVFFGIDSVTLQARRLVLQPTQTDELLRDKALNPFLNSYQKNLADLEKKQLLLVAVDDARVPLATKESVTSRLRELKPYVMYAAKKYSVDPFLIGAILVDELVRLAPFEEMRDRVIAEYLSRDVSVGVGQIMLSTARALIKRERLTLELTGKLKLDPVSLNSMRNKELYAFVVDEKNNICLVAAYIKMLQHEWEQKAGANLTDAIIATLYHLPSRTPHADPKPDQRGLQIVSEFYELAHGILNSV